MGWTPLHCAVVNGDAATIQALIGAGVDLAATDKCGYPSKHYCDDMTLLAFDAAVVQKNAPKAGKRGRKK